MTNGKRLVPGLLALIALLLTLNLVMQVEPQAQAQPSFSPPVVVAGAVLVETPYNLVFRFWSDGAVDRARFSSACFETDPSCVDELSFD